MSASAPPNDFTVESLQDRFDKLQLRKPEPTMADSLTRLSAVVQLIEDDNVLLDQLTRLVNAEMTRLRVNGDPQALLDLQASLRNTVLENRELSIQARDCTEALQGCNAAANTSRLAVNREIQRLMQAERAALRLKNSLKNLAIRADGEGDDEAPTRDEDGRPGPSGVMGYEEYGDTPMGYEEDGDTPMGDEEDGNTPMGDEEDGDGFVDDAETTKDTRPGSSSAGPSGIRKGKELVTTRKKSKPRRLITILEIQSADKNKKSGETLVEAVRRRRKPARVSSDDRATIDAWELGKYGKIGKVGGRVGGRHSSRTHSRPKRGSKKRKFSTKASKQ